MATGPTIRFLIALRNLVKNGGIKTIEQAYDFAKREFGELTTMFKKQIQKTFDDVKKPTVGTPAKKEGSVTPIREGIETLADAKVADEVSPVLDRLSRAIDDAKKQTEKLGKPIDDDDAMRQKSLIEDALRSLRNKRIYEMGSGKEANVRTAVRSFLKKELDEGRLEIPNVYERKMIAETRQGGVDPIDVFRKAYGEDALIAVDDVFEQFGDRLIGPTYRDIEENFRKLFKFNRGFYDMADLPVPKEKYEFEPGLQSVDDLEEELMKQYRQLDDLDRFSVTDRKPNAKGGIMNSRIALNGGGTPLQKLKQEIVDSMKPYAPGVPESKLQIIVKDINFDMSPEEVQAIVKQGFINLFGMATGGRVQAASGGIADILKL